MKHADSLIERICILKVPNVQRMNRIRILRPPQTVASDVALEHGAIPRLQEASPTAARSMTMDGRLARGDLDARRRTRRLLEAQQDLTSASVSQTIAHRLPEG